MKAYLITTGLLFAVLAVLHVWHVIADWPHRTISADFLLISAVLIVLPGVLSWWAFRLLGNLSRDSAKQEAGAKKPGQSAN